MVAGGEEELTTQLLPRALLCVLGSALCVLLLTPYQQSGILMHYDQSNEPLVRILFPMKRHTVQRYV